MGRRAAYGGCSRARSVSRCVTPNAGCSPPGRTTTADTGDVRRVAVGNHESKEAESILGVSLLASLGECVGAWVPGSPSLRDRFGSRARTSRKP